MTQFDSLNVKLSNSQLNNLKSAIENKAEAFWRLSSNMIGNSNDESNYINKLSLTNRQVADLLRAVGNNSSTDVMLSQTQSSRMIQSGGFLGRLLGSLLKTGLPLMKNVMKPLAKQQHW